jgi:signal transduction histidine kinase
VNIGTGQPRRVAVACAVLVAGLVAAPIFGPFSTVPTAVALAAALLTTGPVGGREATWAVGAAVTISIVASVGHSWLAEARAVDVWGYVQMAALMACVMSATRRTSVAAATVLGLAANAAVVLIVLRMISAGPPVSAASKVIACGIFSLGTVAAVVTGGYLRLLDARKYRSVTEARREQQLALAQDLHDFVAHDVSAIVAQAQAGQIAAMGDPTRAVEMFQRVEQAGLRALASMDMAIDALEPSRPAVLAPPPGLRELPELVERFSTPGGVRVRLLVAPDVCLSREADATVYRLVLEALTNVRRHASGAAEVEVSIVRRPDANVELTISNSAAGATRHPAMGRTGGLGLAGIAERVRALGGTLTAGPHEGGWRVQARIPDGDRRAAAT